jgi:YVTN family beta-propeller protein
MPFTDFMTQLKYMINKHKLYSISLASAAIILMIMNMKGTVLYAYITNCGGSNVSVIDIAANKVTATVLVGAESYGIAVSPGGKGICGKSGK